MSNEPSENKTLQSGFLHSTHHNRNTSPLRRCERAATAAAVRWPHPAWLWLLGDPALTVREAFSSSTPWRHHCREQQGVWRDVAEMVSGWIHVELHSTSALVAGLP